MGSIRNHWVNFGARLPVVLNYMALSFNFLGVKRCLKLSTALCILLLLLAMDVERNPGPGQVLDSRAMTLVHMNIQSLYMTSVTNHESQA